MSDRSLLWFYSGMALFGFLIGSVVGLSVSPIANTLVGLLFAFIGGSIVFLIKDRNKEELNKIGKCVSVISIFVVIGLASGLSLRLGHLIDLSTKVIPQYQLKENFTLDEIAAYGNKSEYAELICNLIKRSKPIEESKVVDKKEILKLIDGKVDTHIIHSMLFPNATCHKNGNGIISEQLEEGLNLYMDKSKKDAFSRDLEESASN